MRHVAVWAAVNLISDLIATLPWHTFRDRDSIPNQDDPTATLIADPDPGFVSAIGWRRQVLVSCLLRGNAYGLVVERDRALWPTSIRLLHPDKVRLDMKAGKLAWKVDGEPIDGRDLWRVAAYEVPGSPLGLSPLTYVAEAAGLGLAVQRFGGDWFADSAQPSGLLVNENPITEEIARIAKDRWAAGSGTRDPRVLGNGWKYEPVSINPEESQFLETIQANGAQIATFFGLRPEDLGYKTGDSNTYANVEQRQIDRLTYPILGWVRRLEDALTASMPRPRYVRANVDALIRVDTMTRYKAHDLAIRSGFASRDERRSLEELAPIPDGTGGEFLWPPFRAFPIEEEQ
jgi:HK97 family phage portal protein